VEAVVGDRVAFGLGVPGVEALTKALAARLDGEVDDHRRAAEGRRPGAGLERVLGERAAERQLHVGVDVDAAGDHVAALRVNRLVGAQAGGLEPGPDRRDRLAVDQDVGVVRAVGGDDRPVRDECAHRRQPSRDVMGTGIRATIVAKRVPGWGRGAVACHPAPPFRRRLPVFGVRSSSEHWARDSRRLLAP
jgi:hypothetical protein